MEKKELKKKLKSKTKKELIEDKIKASKKKIVLKCNSKN